MSVTGSLITDRTQADVNRWQALHDKGYGGMTAAELDQWRSGTLKGAYNASDLNRVTSAMKHLAGLYQQYGYAVSYTPLRIPHEDGTMDEIWQMRDIPTSAQMALYLNNLHGFWAAVEGVEIETARVWDNTGFGYSALGTSIPVGTYAALTAANGLVSLLITITSDRLETIAAEGAGWTVGATEDAITAAYTVPQGRYEDLQDALDALVLLCALSEPGAFADTEVTLEAVLRSGARKTIAGAVVRWSSIVNWAAFEGYAMAWADVEAAGMTWRELELLPPPAKGGV